MSIINDASNVKTGDNPTYTLSDFFAMYPQFDINSEGAYLVSITMLTLYLNLAHASIKEARYHDAWQICMGLFIAHFATLYLQSFSSADDGAAAVMAAGQSRGLITSESVGDVSVSTDYNVIAQDLDGWAAWKLTAFGQQLATMAKLVGKGGMYVY